VEHSPEGEKENSMGPPRNGIPFPCRSQIDHLIAFNNGGGNVDGAGAEPSIFGILDDFRAHEMAGTGPPRGAGLMTDY